MKVLILVGIVLLMGCGKEKKEERHDIDPSKVAINEITRT